MVVRGEAEFDLLLETALQQQVGRLVSSTFHRPRYRVCSQARQARAFSGSLRPTRTALLLAVGVLAGSGAAAGAFAGSPVGSWGSTVTNTVQSCQGDLQQGQHGIGSCVSTVARLNGAAQRQLHANPHAAPIAGATPGSNPGQGQSHGHAGSGSDSGDDSAPPTTTGHSPDDSGQGPGQGHSSGHGGGHGSGH